jgi:tRNA pseudouridine55 synthase
MPESPDGIVLLAKQSGQTSFTSLWQVKDALATKKVGHAGTLDTFADGLLVLLAGRMTRLVPYISECDKEYQALVLFGRETDTLDPDGAVIAEAPLPTRSDIERVLPSFLGEITQRPPSYSAVHVGGRRASELMRKGTAVEVPERQVTIHSLTVDSFVSPAGTPSLPDNPVQSMTMHVVCSKGTYIRSLARDIARAAGSIAYLGSLRRLRIGAFSLADAAGVSLLTPFATVPPARFRQGDRPPVVSSTDILSSFHPFTPELATSVGLNPVELDRSHFTDFMNGRPPEAEWFSFERAFGLDDLSDVATEYSVFCGSDFTGVITVKDSRVRYAFVAGGQS